jgi:hypothetical protein
MADTYEAQLCAASVLDQGVRIQVHDVSFPRHGVTGLVGSCDQIVEVEEDTDPEGGVVVEALWIMGVHLTKNRTLSGRALGRAVHCPS